MNKTHVEPLSSRVDGEGSSRQEVERGFELPPAIYQALVKQRCEISSLASAHIVWDSENYTITLLGTEEAVKQTAAVLSQLVALTGGRKVVGRSSNQLSSSNNIQHLSCSTGALQLTRAPPPLHLASATSLLLTSSLPPELTVGQHIGLGRTVSDSQTKLRRKLESEDSSYDSDHEGLVATLSNFHQLSRSHDDISRTPSETLAQEYVDYVSTYPARDPSPVQEARLPSVQESPGDSSGVMELVRSPQYTAKVEYGLKMGYSEKLTQKALTKVGLDAGQDELLQELIRLQEAKTVDPEEIRLKEMQELLRASIPNQPGQETRTKGTLKENTAELRSIVIDGSNVAMSHGNPVGTFSCRGIQICVDWFWKRGHKDIVVFVPKWRKEASKVDVPITSQNLLEEMEKKRQVVFTPSRQVLGKRIVCHDDRYILNYAAENDAVVVSNDNYRELINEKLEYKKVIEERILMYSFVNDTFMPPDDPLGKNGPSLETFLRLKTSTGPSTGLETKACPYKEKCTYGNKCKFFHAERGNLPLHRTESDVKAKQQLARTRSSRPAYGPTPQEALYRLSKTDVAKTKSVEHSTRFAPPHLRNVSIGQLEMGCLSTYGAAPPHFPSAGYTPLQPPPQDQNHHRRLERQLTINPSFDPRINKEKVSPKHGQVSSQPPLLDMEYMRRNLPPPLGLPPQQADDFPHQNVTRNASAPDP